MPVSVSYYNEFDPYAAQWLRNLVVQGLIPMGDVDERSITEVQADDLRGYTQCHFFAGIGGWAYALELAGWPEDRPVWTGSCPCQPFSVAGKGEGQADERHLWPTFASLIGECRPPVVFGEQVAAAVGKDWLDGVCADLEGIGYACGAAVVPACAVDAPHRRDRLWFVADTELGSDRRQIETARNGEPQGNRPANRPSRCGDARNVADTDSSGIRHEPGRSGRQGRAGEGIDRNDCESALAEPNGAGSFSWPDGASARHGRTATATHWAGAQYLSGADGKARRVKPGIRLLAHGVPARVGRLRAYGNAIVPQVAAEVIGAFMECRP